MVYGSITALQLCLAPRGRTIRTDRVSDASLERFAWAPSPLYCNTKAWGTALLCLKLKSLGNERGRMNLREGSGGGVMHSWETHQLLTCLEIQGVQTRAHPPSWWFLLFFFLLSDMLGLWH